MRFQVKPLTQQKIHRINQHKHLLFYVIILTAFCYVILQSRVIHIIIMGIDQIITLLFECKSALQQMDVKYLNLINKIDTQLANYFNSLEQIKQSPTTSKINSCIKPNKQKSQQNAIALKGLYQNSSKLQESKTSKQHSQFSLVNTNLNFLCNNSPTQDMQGEKMNNSLSVHSDKLINLNLRSVHSLNGNKHENNNQKNSPILKHQKERLIKLNHANHLKKVKFQDFFIIQFNFDQNHYEILQTTQQENEQKQYNKLVFSSNVNRNAIDHSFQSQQLEHNIQLKNEQQQFSFKQFFSQVIHPYFNSQLQLQQQKQQSQTHSQEKHQHQFYKKQNQKILSFDLNVNVNNNQNQNDENNFLPNASRLSSSKTASENKISNSEIKNNRKVILDLMFSSIRDHVKQVQKTGSMTQLLKLTTNPSKTQRHLILPSFFQPRQNLYEQKNQDKTQCKYTHIVITTECVKYKKKFYQFERFYVFVQRQGCSYQVDQIVTGINKKIFQLRIKEAHVQQVSYDRIHNTIKQISLTPKRHLYNFISLNLALSQEVCKLSTFWKQIQNRVIQVRISQNKIKSFNLLLLLFYFVFEQYKIVFLSTKNYQQKISQIIMALTHMFGNLRYVYPIIMGTLTNHHFQFVNSPVPMLMGFWGTQHKYKKVHSSLKRIIQQNKSQQNQIGMLIVDLQKNQIPFHQFQSDQLYVIEHFQGCINKFHHDNILKGARRFLNQKLMDPNTILQGQEIDWVRILSQKVQKSQMFQEYMKWKEETEASMNQ